MAGEEDNEVGISAGINPASVDQPFLHIDELVDAASSLPVRTAAVEQLFEMVADILSRHILTGTDERNPHQGLLGAPDDKECPSALRG
jgi:hypothetical protein